MAPMLLLPLAVKLETMILPCESASKPLAPVVLLLNWLDVTVMLPVSPELLLFNIAPLKLLSCELTRVKTMLAALEAGIVTVRPVPLPDVTL